MQNFHATLAFEQALHFKWRRGSWWLDDVEQNIVICQWRVYQIFAPAFDFRANNWSARHWQITIFCVALPGVPWLQGSVLKGCSRRLFIIWSTSLFFNEYPPEAKRSAIFTEVRSQEGERRDFLNAWAEYYLQPNTVGRHCTWVDHCLKAVIYRSGGGLSANEKDEKFASNDKTR